jgi:hypothetical protein
VPEGKRRTLGAPTCSGTGTASFVGGGSQNVADATDSAVLEGLQNEVCDSYSSIGGGYNNYISDNGPGVEYSFIGGGGDNTVTSGGGYGVIGGGTSNAVSGGNYNAILGGNSNTVSGGDSVVGGGYGNTLSGSDSVIAGGSGNTLTSAARYGFIGGGNINTVSAQYGVTGGGNSNTVSGEYGVIGGGNTNTASGSAAVIGGGQGSYAEGAYATVPGGYDNNAAGELSFAAGFKSYARYAGSFVWSDYASGATLLESTAVNQFLARATGGFTLWTNSTNSVGATLAPGSGTWASASDRNLKTDVARIDDAAVLDKVASLPISRWSYKSEHGVRHVGPMAQDFYAAFGVGEDDKHITSIDEDGVALAAIKALHARVSFLDAEDAKLRARLTAENATLHSRLAADEAHVRQVDAELAHIVAVLRK